MTSADITPSEGSGNNDSSKAYVYAIAAGSQREQFTEQSIKIGRAEDPTKRFRQLQTSHSQELRLFYQKECGRDEASEIEREAHSILAHTRLTGEWFKTTMYQAQMAISCAADRVRQRDAWDRYDRAMLRECPPTPRTDAAEEAARGSPLKLRERKAWEIARGLEKELFILRILKDKAA
jgi:hypothetical protein